MDQSNNLPSEGRAIGEASTARRRPDTSSALTALLALPEFAGSLMVLSLVSAVAPGTPWLLPVIWLPTGAVLVIPQVERMILRLKFGVRQPYPDELSVLAAPWRSVCQVAGVDPARYVLMVEDSDDINAFAAGGRTVSVTQAALRLPPNHLEAVLAHEFGHHLPGHAFVSMLAWWYAMPARVAAYLVGLVVRLVLAIGRVLAVLGDGVAALASVLVALMILVVFAFLSFWLILLPLTAPLHAWTMRLGETRADRTAAMLGYGPALIEVLRTWISMDGSGGRPRGLRARLLSTHPSHTDRIRLLNEFLRR